MFGPGGIEGCGGVGHGLVVDGKYVIGELVRIQLHIVPFLVPYVAIARNQIGYPHGVRAANTHFVPGYLHPTALSVVGVKINHAEYMIFLVFALFEIGQKLAIVYGTKVYVVGIMKSLMVFPYLVYSGDQSGEFLCVVLNI